MSPSSHHGALCGAGEGEERAVQLSFVPQPPTGASASEGYGGSKKRKHADSEGDASEADSEAAALREQRRALIRGLRDCARTRDASGALAIFGQMEAASMTLESADCSLLLHLFSEAEPAPLYAESVRLFDAARAALRVGADGAVHAPEYYDEQYYDSFEHYS